MKKWIFITLIAGMLTACRTYELPPLPQPTHFNGLMCNGLATGNLLFVYGQSGEMDQAIQAATGQYTHVGIAECTDSGVYVVEALPRRGVIRRPLDNFVRDNAIDTNNILDNIHIYYPDAEYDTTCLMLRLHQYLGQPYDDYFATDNGRMYCSELVYECFFNNKGHHLFSAQPMNFYDSTGRLPDYWQFHFDSLGVPPPQGELGTNPNDMAKAPFLQRLRIK